MRAAAPAGARRRPLVVIVGPTAVGKTALSLALARRWPVEVISADSRLFYRGLDIGTAKPSPEERRRTPHHLIDIRDPDQTLSLGAFQRLAYSAVDAVHARGGLPLLVGGTGQYVRAVVEGWGIPAVAPRPRLRAALERQDTAALNRWLAALDPAAAADIDDRNRRRLVRALEVILISGRPFSIQRRKSPPPYDTLIIGLNESRERLYARADARVEAMWAAGLVDEVRALRAAGYRRDLPAMSSLGYREIWAYLDGALSREEALARLKSETHRLIRQQANWFRRDDPAIVWFDAAEKAAVATAVADYLAAWLAGRTPPPPVV